MKYDIEQRKELARQLRKQGLNCCQCVAMAFGDVTGMDPETIKRVAEGFGRLEGSCVCRELKKPGRKPCLELITDMVGLVHTRLENDGK